jgi:RecA/RadA recombinase
MEKEKKKKKAPPSIFTDYREKMGKTIGKGNIYRADEIPLGVRRIPTGLFPFDYASGGGLPQNAISMFWGPEGGGKTTTLLRTIASVQQTCFKCFRHFEVCRCKKGPREVGAILENLEGDLDLEYAQDLGVDLKRLIILEPETGEEALLTAQKAIDYADCGIIGIDSIASVVTEAGLEDAAIYSQRPAPSATLIGKGITRIRHALTHRGRKKMPPVVVLATNQMRSLIGVQFGPTQTMMGGWALKHHLSLRALFERLSIDKEAKKRYTIDDKLCLTRHKFTFKKMRTRHLMDSWEYLQAIDTIKDLGLRRGQIHDLKTVTKYAENTGVLQQEGNKWSCLGNTFKSQKEFRSFLAQRDGFYFTVHKAIIDAKIKECEENASACIL